MPSWESAAIAVALAIGLSILELFLNRGRARAKARREASTKFHSAFFAEAIAHLDNKDAYLLMSQAQAKHDAAIIAFRPFVDPKSGLSTSMPPNRNFVVVAVRYNREYLRSLQRWTQTRPLTISTELN
jgi:hypothetical protein